MIGSKSLATLAFACVAIVTVQAAAFCRSRTCDPRTTQCDTDERGCIVEGELLFWDAVPVSIWVGARGTELRGISGEATRSATVEAFATWLGASCAEGPPDVSVLVEGLLPGAAAGFDDTEGATNANVVAYVDAAWPHAVSAVALTTMTFNTRTGEVVDSDVELNSATFSLAIDPAPTEIDLGAILVHEAGHVLGLAHSDVDGATMQPESQGFGFGELASIEPDDVAGLCEIYPPFSEPEPPDPGEEPSPRSSDGGCSCRHARAAGAPAPWLALLAFCGARLRFKTRRSGSPGPRSRSRPPGAAR